MRLFCCEQDGLFDNAAGEAEPMVGAVYHTELSRCDTLYAAVRYDTNFLFSGSL